ncbi:MAG: hypothetical protein CME63_12280 [Halobacteriovoraceae bacterium]|nr:hypothetical protein [Halobacteriovoraceae bacterium]MBC98520.1 hypothetical protein [Halobacteriovoraceae bacterium]|tara:strand:+ start:5163 stop:6140 length:978 start_codon:yes stop_codon:yes gene_type:complete
MQARSIIILTFLLFIFAPDKDYTKSRSLPKIQGDPLQTSYLFGIKAPLSKPLLKAHRALGIQHFMTPSGLHLSVFSTLIFLFLKGRAARFLLLLSFYILSLRFHHIDSFQRMLVFAALRHNPWIKISTHHSFLISFLLLSYQYFLNPMSYTLSFLFLGILLCPGPVIRKAFFLLVGQFLVSFWFNQQFYLLGPLYGYFLTGLSFLIFPLILIEFIFNIGFLTGIWKELLLFLNQIRGPEVLIPLSTFLPFLITRNGKLKRIALTLGLLITVSDLYNPKLPSYRAPVPLGYKEKTLLKNGVRLDYENGMRCYSRLKGDEWIGHCYK